MLYNRVLPTLAYLFLSLDCALRANGTYPQVAFAPEHVLWWNVIATSWLAAAVYNLIRRV